MGPQPIDRLELPSGTTHRPYSLAQLSGEIIHVPLSKSIVRLLVTGEETDKAFAVVALAGSGSDPIGFHCHREAHDTFLCLRGSVNIWAGDKCRTLGPGDYGSVPPNTIHQYQVLGDHSEFTGLIFPGGWEEFFRDLGEPWSGPVFPYTDDRNPLDVLVPKLQWAHGNHDVVLVPEHPFIEPRPWPENEDDSLPGTLEPYFLKNDRGTKYLVGGLIMKPLGTTAESAGKFSIASIGGSSYHKGGIFDSTFIKFQGVHHCFYVTDGLVEVEVRGAVNGISQLSAGESVFIPAGLEFRFRFTSKFPQFYVFCNAGGLVELLRDVGREFAEPVPPKTAEAWDEAKLKSQDLQKSLDYSLHN
ncbi:RmlC-like cupin domain-containing protein [Colletotrichum phormii]|uniref:RmlC-like cupin domain-containing protein n=1 Tax=Colletotrichum phormii TaxID=359342 RepID=A0AAI9ZIZ6_9PEZI|nr:RmlC-like cupin domain-containing protein [Colletotrichum phormii]KAK1625361.1 RmlC-like cupin domain-containing protein [Colletotrichum phormii]